MIRISNLVDGEVLTYSLALLEGTTPQLQWESCNLSLTVWTQDSTKVISWPVVNCCFKAFVLLQPGKNVITLKYGYHSTEFILLYSPIHSPYIVKPLYIVCSDDSGEFQAPTGIANSKQSACDRINLAALLMQTFTATQLKRNNLGARVFNLPQNSENSSCCDTFYTCLTVQQTHTMSARELWKFIGTEIMTSNMPEKQYCKFLAFISSTRYKGELWNQTMKYKDIINITNGYVALGGGGLALLGSATLYTWAEKLEQLVECFTNVERINPRESLDDSAYRGTYWANYSTGLGAALHELGHTFDLHHTADGIMARGFDNMHRFFVLEGAAPVEQPDKQYLVRIRKLQQRINLSSDCTTPSCQDRLAQVYKEECFSLTESVFEDTLDTATLKSNISSTTTSDISYDSDLNEVALEVFGLCPQDLSSDLSPSDSVDPSACSAWAMPSAAMLRYSRWFLDEEELRANRNKAPITVQASILRAPAGIRNIQVYCRERGCIISYSTYHIGKSLPLKMNVISLGQQRVQPNHKHCCELHVRDSSGHFLILPPPAKEL